MFQVPVSVQVSSSNPSFSSLPSHTPIHETDVIHPVINQDGNVDHNNIASKGNNNNMRTNCRGPPPVPPPKPPDLMKKGIASMTPSLHPQIKSTNLGPTAKSTNAQSHLSLKPIKPPKPAGLLNRANSVNQASITCQNNDESKSVQEIGLCKRANGEKVNGNELVLEQGVIEEGVDEVTDENANVPEAEHIHVTRNSLTYDSSGDCHDLRAVHSVDTSHNTNGIRTNGCIEPDLPSSSSSSSSSSLSSNKASVSRETSKCDISSSGSDRGMSFASTTTTTATGLNRRNSNIERITSQITASHIQRSFSSRSELRPKLMSGQQLINPRIIQPAKSTASVDSDDSSDEMDLSIELSIGLQRELRRFLEKRKLKENKGSAAARQANRESLERERREDVLKQQLTSLERKTSSSTSSSVSLSFQQPPPTLDNNNDQPDSCEKEEEEEREGEKGIVRDTNGICAPVVDEEEDLDVGLDQEEVKRRKKQQKLYFIAKEITSSEADFVDKLHLLNNEFRAVAEKHLPPEALKTELQLLKYLPQLTTLSESLLSELQQALESWPKTHKIAHVIVKIGPFLKQYSSFIKEFDKSSSQLDEATRKYPYFAAGLRELEATPRCGKLLIKHFLLKPIQRIPQYRLLLRDYQKNLTENHPDEKDTETALKIVSDVAEHANNTMKQCENFLKLQAIQNNLLGTHEVIKPGRILLKESDMFKRSRRNLQPRRFILCSDCLFYMTLLQTGTYRLNHEISLSGMRIILPQQYDFKSELTIRSPKRSFTIVANDESERDVWYEALHKAITEHNGRRSTLSNNLTLPIDSGIGSRPSSGSSTEPTSNVNLGDEQPVWIPDTRVTMCQLCTAGFGFMFRRHHCRACGLVVCEACSSSRAPLKYLDYKPSRVCDVCNTILMNNIIERKQRRKSFNDVGSETGSISSQTNLDDTPEVEEEDEESDGNQLSRFKRVTVDKTRASQRIPKIPGVRKVPANDPEAEVSGYLLLREKKKKTWSKFWFMVKELDTDIKVLYKFKESEDIAALDSVPLLGWYVSSISGPIDGHPEHLLFQLTHPGLSSFIFKSEDEQSKERWMNAMEDRIQV